ncbi:sulfite exporter TauE/SafE family protein [Amycolatopsis saalfeldensis]|uniref:Probable membrane transporter protein n=1 Tax=Amycolatopsis saalfeldensis TaxID=394193 RepID=A0A1H8UDS2_9PSEU|nr:sulfite exporter TauE/SafE family protein [Amycolatopsis saalfeldensis]SEP01369.1 hypothetical protein SAMN04489732_103219 [Amycolatopsis saalfeldensis]
MTTYVLLGLFGLVGGIGITAFGPGGVLPTIGLFLLTPLAPAQVAGTAIVTHVATGALGTAAYVHSGQLREVHTRRIAGVLAATAVVGAPVGVWLNSLVSARLFGLLLAVFAVVVAGLVWLRDRRGTPVRPDLPAGLVVGLGLVVATAAGLVGVGGPMLTVPLLVACGVPMLEGLAAAQAQSVVIAGAGTIGYLVHGAVDGPLALVIGLPELAGVLLGWKLARRMPVRRLKIVLIAALLAVAPYLAFHGG